MRFPPSPYVICVVEASATVVFVKGSSANDEYEMAPVAALCWYGHRTCSRTRLDDTHGRWDTSATARGAWRSASKGPSAVAAVVMGAFSAILVPMMEQGLASGSATKCTEWMRSRPTWPVMTRKWCRMRLVGTVVSLKLSTMDTSIVTDHGSSV